MPIGPVIRSAFGVISANKVASTLWGRALQSPVYGMKMALGSQQYLLPPLLAASFAMATRGEKLSSMTSAAAGIGLGSGALGALGFMVGGPFGGAVGTFAGGFLVDNYISNTVKAGMDYIHNIGMNAYRLETGYQNQQFANSPTAYTMRQLAVQEMSGSLLNARQYLGQEANFLHQ